MFSLTCVIIHRGWRLLYSLGMYCSLSCSNCSVHAYVCNLEHSSYIQISNVQFATFCIHSNFKCSIWDRSILLQSDVTVMTVPFPFLAALICASNQEACHHLQGCSEHDVWHDVWLVTWYCHGVDRMPVGVQEELKWLVEEDSKWMVQDTAPWHVQWAGLAHSSGLVHAVAVNQPVWCPCVSLCVRA